MSNNKEDLKVLEDKIKSITEEFDPSEIEAKLAAMENQIEEKTIERIIETLDINKVTKRIAEEYVATNKKLLNEDEFKRTDEFVFPDSYSMEVKLLDEFADIMQGPIDPQLYDDFKVFRGLRDDSGKGVLTGLTRISEIVSHIETEDGQMLPIDGKLYYRGYDIEDLIQGFLEEDRFGFEEVAFLLLFGRLPSEEELKVFTQLLVAYRKLPIEGFVRQNILFMPSVDIMNNLSRCVLSLYFYDENAGDTSISNVIRQCMELIALFPRLVVYAWHAYNHYVEKDGGLVIHEPDSNLSIAETILQMLRPDSKYTRLEAKVLDLCLILHAEHGGGNNSTFTTHVVTSSGTDTYSAISASLGSLKGPKHGGANIKVYDMFRDIEENVSNWKDDAEVEAYLEKILNKEAFDKQGLIYGMGHAIYTKSDPRARVLKGFVDKLAKEKGYLDELDLYERVERLAPKVLEKHGRVTKQVSANVDFYSGLVYKMLGLPKQIFTPLFAIARIVGWSAHRLEELINGGKIIRPAYTNVQERKEYIPIAERTSELEFEEEDESSN